MEQEDQSQVFRRVHFVDVGGKQITLERLNGKVRIITPQVMVAGVQMTTFFAEVSESVWEQAQQELFAVHKHGQYS